MAAEASGNPSRGEVTMPDDECNVILMLRGSR
jgi:hypothetical protein